MNTPSLANNRGKSCPEYERLLALYAWDELEPQRRAAVEQHVATCAACAAGLEHERRLVEVLASAESEEPSELFLATCRSALSKELDHTQMEIGWFTRMRMALGRLRFSGWVSQHPAWGAALLVLLGMAVGRFAPQMRGPGDTNQPAVPVAGANNAVDVTNGSITGIRRLAGDGVEVFMTAEQPVVLKGSPEDQKVRLALVRALRAGDNYDPDVRLDSVELLKPLLQQDTGVREALCQAARSDLNTSVRLKAVEALRGFEHDDQVRQTLLDVLQHDKNPGVRVEAVSALRAFLENQSDQTPALDESITKVLADRKAKDPNEFVRLQSAAAMQQIAAKKEY